jgi:nucleotide-binding universal stress UspA family protein
VSSVPIALHEILLATDFCVPALRALAFAKQIARRRSASVRAVHVLDLTGDAPTTQHSFAAAHDSAERALRDIRRELRVAGVENSATLISAGKPAEALRGLVQLHHPSLLILGLNGSRSKNTAALGATSRSLLAAPPCPILTVNERCTAPSANAPERIVIVIDAAAGSLRAALDAWPLAPHQPPRGLLTIQPRGAKRTWLLPAALQRRFRPIEVVDSKSAAAAVLNHAKESGASLILAAFGSGAPLASLTRGSVAHTLLTQAPCPVLTVPVLNVGS